MACATGRFPPARSLPDAATLRQRQAEIESHHIKARFCSQSNLGLRTPSLAPPRRGMARAAEDGHRGARRRSVSRPVARRSSPWSVPRSRPTFSMPGIRQSPSSLAMPPTRRSRARAISRTVSRGSLLRAARTSMRSRRRRMARYGRSGAVCGKRSTRSRRRQARALPRQALMAGAALL